MGVGGVCSVGSILKHFTSRWFKLPKFDVYGITECQFRRRGLGGGQDQADNGGYVLCTSMTTNDYDD
jgi:hypothetical protein